MEEDIENIKTPVYLFNGDDSTYFEINKCVETFHHCLNGKRDLYIHSEPGLEHTIGEEGFVLLRKYFDKFVGRKPLEGI